MTLCRTIPTPAYLEELTELGQYLNDIGYADCFYSYVNMPFQFRDCLTFLHKARSILPRDTRIVIRLLALGERVGTEEIKLTGLQRFIQPLLAGGILLEESGGSVLRTNDVRCQVVDGCYLFVSQNTNGGDILAYFGEDSIKLSRHLIGFPSQSALDFCCGSGIQSILMARRGMNVMGVDIHADVLRLAIINSRINQVHHMIRFVNSSIQEFVPDEPFDVIVANPPLVPIANDLKYSIVGDGGESGLVITSAIIEKIHCIRNPQARAVIIGMCLGSGDKPEILSWLKTFLVTQSTSTTVFLINKFNATYMSVGLAYTSHLYSGESYNTCFKQMLELCQRRNADCFYAFMIKLQRGVCKSNINVIPIYKKSEKLKLWYVS